MASLNELLTWMDNKRRVAGRNISDLVENPGDYLSGVANQLPHTVREYANDPMNFVGGGVGSLRLIKSGKINPVDDFGLLNYAPPKAGAMSSATTETSGLGRAMKKLNSPKGADFGDIPDSRGLYPVTVDGIPVFYEQSLLEARNASKIIDVDFWRGEMQNFSPTNLRPLSDLLESGKY